MNPGTPILSICIPTFNRSKYLRSNLLSIFQDFTDNGTVEIVISDNCSDDGTAEVCREFSVFDSLKYYKQSSNIGGIPNLFKVVDYAKGKYCWIIGDDDFVLPGALKNITELIAENSEINFFYVRIRTMELEEYDRYPVPFISKNIGARKPEKKFELLQKWEFLLNPNITIIFLGELMGSVFRREKWMENKNICIDGEPLETLNTTYPHSVIFANAFFSEKAIFIEEPMIIALNGARSWWNRVGFINIEIVKQLMDHYISKGLSNEIRRKCYEAYIQLTIPSALMFLFNPGVTDRKKVNLGKYFRFLLAHPIITIKKSAKLFLQFTFKYSRRLLVKTARLIFPSLFTYLKKKLSK